MQLTTTLKKIEELKPSEELKQKLHEALGEEFDRDKEFPVSMLLTAIDTEELLLVMRSASINYNRGPGFYH